MRGIHRLGEYLILLFASVAPGRATGHCLKLLVEVRGVVVSRLESDGKYRFVGGLKQMYRVIDTPALDIFAGSDTGEFSEQTLEIRAPHVSYAAQLRNADVLREVRVNIFERGGNLAVAASETRLCRNQVTAAQDIYERVNQAVFSDQLVSDQRGIIFVFGFEQCVDNSTV